LKSAIGKGGKGKGGSADSQFNLVRFVFSIFSYDIFLQGHLYLKGGNAVEKNEKEGFEWFHEAADQNHGEAALNCGILASKGVGTEKNDKAAFEWFLKAAKSGNSDAQFNAGTCYL